MNFLHPLFLLAAAGIAVPLVLHLARRRNREARPWSTLRFLQPAPPRLERRARIEHWALLALRSLVVVVLAVTFARPLLRRPLPGLSAPQGARVVLLLDTSASMRRQGLWDAVLAGARSRVRALGAQDRLAIVAFSDRARTVLSFDEWAQVPGAARADRAEARLAALGPGWGATDLGAALVAAAEAVIDDVVAAPATAGEQMVVLLSDLAQGARLTKLTASEWPTGLRLLVHRVEGAAAGTNLALQAVPETSDAPMAGTRARVRVRVTASASEAGVVGVGGNLPGRGRLMWSDDGGAGPNDGQGGAIDVTVPAGASQVLDAPARRPIPGTLVLEGDAHDFDNRLAVVPAVPVESRVVYLGRDDAEDATGSLYFLSRAFPRTRTRVPLVQAHRNADADLAAALKTADLVVVTQAPGAASDELRAYLDGGGTALFAPRDAEAGQGLGALLGGLGGLGGSAIAFREAPAGREAVLTAVQIQHPLLAPFADGRSGDFTRVRFWKHRVFDPAGIAGAQVLARFDDGSPAWLLLPVGRGQLFVMTAGWNTGDSQLGLSSKLVPLLWSLLDSGARGGAADVAGAAGRLVGDPLPLGGLAKSQESDDGAMALPLTVKRPDGRTVTLAAGSTHYGETDQPGIYEVARGARTALFAVNVAPAESAITPLALEHLERAGIPVTETGGQGAPVAGAQAASGRANQAAGKQHQDPERQREDAFSRLLEAQQRPWRWALLLALLLLAGEALLTLRRGPVAEPPEEGRT